MQDKLATLLEAFRTRLDRQLLPHWWQQRWSHLRSKLLVQLLRAAGLFHPVCDHQCLFVDLFTG